MTEGSGTGAAWRAALEQLPPDSRGFRRTLRLHAVAFQDMRPAPRAACGYQHRPDELRPERSWQSVTPSGRCTLCELRLRRAPDNEVDLVHPLDLDHSLHLADSLDLVDRDHLVDRDQPGSRPHLIVVSEQEERTGSAERRSPGRP